MVNKLFRRTRGKASRGFAIAAVFALIAAGAAPASAARAAPAAGHADSHSHRSASSTPVCPKAPAQPAAGGPPYSYQVEASTFSGPYDELFPRVGLQSNGHVSFVATGSSPTVEKLYTCVPDQAPAATALPGAPSSATSPQASPGVTSNDSGTRVMTVRDYNSTQYVLATVSPAGDSTIIARGGPGHIFSSIDPEPAIGPGGRVAFIATATGSSNADLYVPKNLSPPQPGGWPTLSDFYAAQPDASGNYPAGPPAIDSSGQVVTTAPDGVLLYNSTLSSRPTEIATSGSANSACGFPGVGAPDWQPTGFGQRPAISDDGTAIAFTGNRVNSAGNRDNLGLFLCVNEGAAGWELLTIAGAPSTTGGESDLGDLGLPVVGTSTTILGPGNKPIPIEGGMPAPSGAMTATISPQVGSVNSGDVDGGIVVLRAPAAGGGKQTIVVFAATPQCGETATDVCPTGTAAPKGLDGANGAPGIFMSSVLDSDVSNSGRYVPTSQNTYRCAALQGCQDAVRPPEVVLQVGQSLPDGTTVTSLTSGGGLDSEVAHLSASYVSTSSEPSALQVAALVGVKNSNELAGQALVVATRTGGVSGACTPVVTGTTSQLPCGMSMSALGMTFTRDQEAPACNNPNSNTCDPINTPQEVAVPYEDQSHYCTFGYGHLIVKSPCNTLPADYQHAWRSLQPTDAMALFYSDTYSHNQKVAAVLPQQVPLTQSQLDALDDWVYNVGTSAFTAPSQVLTDLEYKNADHLQVQNTVRYQEAPRFFFRIITTGKNVSCDLIQRRVDEYYMFTEGKYVNTAYYACFYLKRIYRSSAGVDSPWGPVSGGDDVTLTGDSHIPFNGTVTVWFDGSPVTVAGNNQTALTVKIPAHLVEGAQTTDLSNTGFIVATSGQRPPKCTGAACNYSKPPFGLIELPPNAGPTVIAIATSGTVAQGYCYLDPSSRSLGQPCLSATATQATHSVKLAWAAPGSPSPITRYVIKNGKNPNPTKSVGTIVCGSNANPCADLTFTDHNPPSGTSYYTVTACTTGTACTDTHPPSGTAATSNQVQVTLPPASVPGQPTESVPVHPQAPASVPSHPQSHTRTRATAAGGTPVIQIAWTVPPDGGSPITGYDILRGTTSGGETYLDSTDPTQTSYADTTVTAGTTYYYEVVAVNAVGDGKPSNQVATAPYLATIPQPPALSGTAGNQTVTLNWSAPADGGLPVAGYNIYRGTSSGGETYFDNVPASATSYTDDDVTNGVTYYYQVTATNLLGESQPSNEVSLLPAKPTSCPSAGQGGTASIVVVTSKSVSGPASAAATLGPLTVTEEDGFGAGVPAPAGGTVISLSSTSTTGVFSATNAGADATSVTIPAGACTATFFYGDTTAGSPSVTVNAANLVGTSQQETITAAAAAKLEFTSQPVTGTTSGQASLGPITVQEDDAYGNTVAAPASGTTVSLTSSSASGVFSATSGGSAVTSVTIAAGSTSASFYYGDSTAGSPTITAAAHGLASATQAEAIAGPPAPVASCLDPTESWTGAAGDNNFDNPANWTANVVPGPGYSVCIPATGGATINGGSETVASIESFMPLSVGNLTTTSTQQESAFHASVTFTGAMSFAGPVIADGAGTVIAASGSTWELVGAGSLQVQSPATFEMPGLPPTADCGGGPCSVPIVQLAQLGISAGATLQIQGFVQMEGPVITSAGTIALSQGVTFAGWPVGGSTMSATLISTGTIDQSDNTTSIVVGDLRLDGTVNVPAGTLELGTTATESGGAAFSVGAGATLSLGAYPSTVWTLTAAKPLSGPGTVEQGLYSGGTVVVDAAVTVSNLMLVGQGTLQLQSGGTISALTAEGSALAVGGTVTIPAGGTATFSGGNLSGAGNLDIDSGASLILDEGELAGTGTINVAQGATVTVPGAGTPTLGQTLVNDGTMTLQTVQLGAETSPGALQCQSGGGLTNNAIIDLAGDSTIFDASYGGDNGCALANDSAGVITKSAGTGISTLGGVPANAGTINVDSGTISLENDSGQNGIAVQTVTSSGVFTVADGATLQLLADGPAQDITLTTASRVTGSGTLTTGGDGTDTVDGAFSLPAVQVGQEVTLDLGTGPLTLSALTVGGGTLDTAADITISSAGTASFQGNLSGAGNLDIGSGASLTVQEGMLAGTGTITVAQGAAATIPGESNPELGQPLVNDGTLTLQTSGSIPAIIQCLSGGGGAVTNNGTIDLAGDSTIFGASYGGDNGCTVTNNSGAVITKSAGTGTSTLGGLPDNAGTINVDTGTISLENDSGENGIAAQTATSSGAFTVADGATLQLLGYGSGITFTSASQVTGQGTLIAGGNGTDTLDGAFSLPAIQVAQEATLGLGTGPLTLSALTVSGTLDTAAGITISDDGTASFQGNLSGAGNLDISSGASLTVQEGVLAGTGTITVAQGATATVPGESNPQLGQPLVNDGTLTLQTSGSIPAVIQCHDASGAVTNNGTIDLAGDSTIFDASYGGENGCPLTNDSGAVITKSAGTGTSTLGGLPDNAGTINVDTGTISLENDIIQNGTTAQTATSSGAFTVAAGATLQLLGYGSGVTFTSASQVTGQGTLLIAGSSDTLDGAVSLPDLTISPSASLTLGTTSLTGVTLTNNGVLTLPASLVTVAGYAQTGSLDIPVSSATSYGALSAATADITAGTATIIAQGSYVPAVGTQFSVLDATSGLSGTFSGVFGPSGQTYAASYTSTQAYISRTG